MYLYDLLIFSVLSTEKSNLSRNAYEPISVIAIPLKIGLILINVLLSVERVRWGTG